MASRRGFLAGLMATGLTPRVSWADAGAPAYLAAAQLPGGAYNLFGLTDTGAEVFRLPLPDRGHAAAAHPSRPEAVAFARRPGTFAVVLDCASGRIHATLEAPVGRHFYGHGAFSPGGDILFTPENDFENARGVIGMWDALDGYARIGEFDSGGIGPHDTLLIPGTDVLAVANGGIETHPASGRAKLNIPMMQPNLSYVTIGGELLETVDLPHDYRRNSLRHLSVRDDGLVAFAMQWQGDVADSPPLAGLHRRGGEMRFASADPEGHRRMQGYAGSVSFSDSGDRFAITSPRGGLVQVFSADDAQLVETVESEDVCGVNAGVDGFVFTAGTGLISSPGAELSRHAVAWDNHLVRIPSPVRG